MYKGLAQLFVEEIQFISKRSTCFHGSNICFREIKEELKDIQRENIHLCNCEAGRDIWNKE